MDLGGVLVPHVTREVTEVSAQYQRWLTEGMRIAEFIHYVRIEAPGVPLGNQNGYDEPGRANLLTYFGDEI
jgi:hypothetical protein